MAVSLCAGGGGGGVSGPGSSTDRAIATWNGTGGTALFDNSTTNISSSGAITNSGQPAFQAYLSGNVSNVTGNGTVYKIAFNSTSYDQSSNFNTGTFTFTAPVSGIYCFSGCVYAVITNPLEIQATINLVTTSTNFFVYNAAGAQVAGGGTLAIAWAKQCKMSAGDTAYVTLTVSGGLADVIVGGLLGLTTFEGFLVC